MKIELLQTLHEMTLETARKTAETMIAPKTKPLVKQRLKMDLAAAHNSAEVSRIMWQVYMSGSGLGTVGSTWKKHYNNA